MIFKENKEQINLFIGKEEEILKRIKKSIEKKESLKIGFLYFSILIDIKNNKKLKKDFQDYDLVLPDGIGLQIYYEKVFNKKIENLNGTDFLPKLIKYMKEHKIKYAFYGTNKKNISDCANKNNPYFYQNGFEKLELKYIEDNSVLILGLGTWNHEKFIKENKEEIEKKKLVVISAGGFFDFCSGNVKRAPAFIRKIKLEFLYRLIINPKQHLRKNINNLKINYYIRKDRK
jgi:N-acetylglucosaminyldiphosphoundecaprenol N-acetyl-beta-D-mannosaminyltransferase